MTSIAPRIAVVAIGDPESPSLWSGTPSNIVRALRASGAEVVAVDLRSALDGPVIDAVAAPRVLAGLGRRGLRAGLDRERRVAQQSMLLARARARTARRLFERIGAIDGVVQMGTGFTVPHRNVVSYEDMTTVQALAWPDTFWGDVPKHMAEARVRQQASAYRRNHAAAFSTDWAAQSAVTWLHCPPGKARVVGIGPNFSAHPVGDRDWTTPRFLFAGREWSRKNGPAVVEAFARVRELFPTAELHLAGHLPPIDRPGIVRHGHLDLAVPADRDRMLELWSTATCCVVPSRFEPAGIIYVEAMHAGIPSIGTTQGGAPDIIGDAGRVVDPGDPRALTAAMLEFCDPAAAAAAGRRARRRSELFSWSRVATGLRGAIGLEDVPNDDGGKRRRHVE